MYYFLVNPASKTGLGKKYWKRVKKILEERKIEYQVSISQRAGHAEELVRELVTGKRGEKIHIVILGGDGTVNEAIQGIDDFQGISLSYIPTGSSNDLARDLKISKKPEEALEGILAAGRQRYMDLGLVHYETAFLQGKPVQIPDRKFMVGCGIGYDAAVCEESLRSTFKRTLNKVKLGKLTYLGIALKQLIQSEMIDGKLVLDDTKEIPIKRMIFAVSMVHHYEGGGFMFCPDALDDDGRLDFCVGSNAGKLRILRILPTAFRGNHVRFKEIRMFRAKKALIEVERPMWVQTDGEVKAQTTKIILSDLGQKVHFIY